MGSRACVYIDYRNKENDTTRGILRICGPTTTLASLQHDAETCAEFGEVFEGLRIFFEDPIKDPKQAKSYLVEQL